MLLVTSKCVDLQQMVLTLGNAAIQSILSQGSQQQISYYHGREPDPLLSLA